MSVSNNTTTFFNGNSAISFRSLQETFGGNVNSVSLSTYKRNTDLSATDPIVPNATENASISDTNSNIQLADFRGSIKEYILTQSSTDTTLDIDAQSWNSNLGKNVIKKFQVNGTIGSTSVSSTAAEFNATAYNFRMIVSGNIYGEGGAGGSGDNANGGSGGNALRLTTSTTDYSTGSGRARIEINSNGRIWAGGGGGGSGNGGNSGSDLNCYFNTIETQNVYSGGSTNPGRACNRVCSAAGNKSATDPVNSNTIYASSVDNGSCSGTGGQRSRCRGSQDRGQTCTNNYDRNCTYKFNYTQPGGTGGNHGNGGVGQGYSNQSGAGGGNSGNSGNTTNCAAVNSGSNSSQGNSGNSGASGGSWGSSGGNASDGQGGSAGYAIFKSNGNTISVSGSSSNNVKGQLDT